MRSPLPPPFSVGTRLRYVGTRGACFTVSGVQLSGRGMRDVIIEEVRLGHRGTGRQLHDHDGPMVDDDGMPIVDVTTDGCSVYRVEVDGRDSPTHGKHRLGRLIRHENAADWEIVIEPNAETKS